MTTKYEDDTTGEQYTSTDLSRDNTISGDGLWEAGVHIRGPYDSVDFHPEHADYDELRRQLHEMVDSAVDAWEEEPADG